MSKITEEKTRALRLIRSLVYYEWKVAQLGNPSDEQSQAELEVYRQLASHRRSMLVAQYAP